tara:strand:- start:1583 stop:2029 length:447 start_codon:yes stop_codon:yes gene_type:complete
VRRADFSRRVQALRNSEAKFDQFSSDDGIPESEVRVHVLKEAKSWSDLSDDSGEVRPEVPWVVGASSPAGRAERLARVAASDAIHKSTPRLAVEGSNIIPDRRFIQEAIFHTRDQNRGCNGFSLDVADGAGGGHCETDSQLQPADSGT